MRKKPTALAKLEPSSPPGEPWRINERTTQLVAFAGHVCLDFGAFSDDKPYTASCFVRGEYLAGRGRSVASALKKLERLVRAYTASR